LPVGSRGGQAGPVLAFKPSRSKKLGPLAHLATNIHLHTSALRFRPLASPEGGETVAGVASFSPGSKERAPRAFYTSVVDEAADGEENEGDHKAVVSTVTFGAPAAHALGFKHGES
jgi:hypothetical protein